VCRGGGVLRHFSWFGWPPPPPPCPAAGYLAFPTSVSSNVLNTFPSDAVIQVRGRGSALPGSGLQRPWATRLSRHPHAQARHSCGANSAAALSCPDLPCLAWWTQVARAVIGLVVVGHFPTNHHPARNACEDFLAGAWGKCGLCVTPGAMP